jgi:hypothetical protein
MQVDKECDGHGRQERGQRGGRDDGEGLTSSRAQSCELRKRKTGGDATASGKIQGGELVKEVKQEAVRFGLRADTQVE